MSSEDEIIQAIRQQLAAVPDFGQAQFYIKKHIGSFNSMDVVKMSNFRYAQPMKEKANADCANDVIGLMKGVQNADVTGTLGFSIQFKKGKAELMQVQDFKKL